MDGLARYPLSFRGCASINTDSQSPTLLCIGGAPMDADRLCCGPTRLQEVIEAGYVFAVPE
jgi:hypothetical protein